MERLELTYDCEFVCFAVIFCRYNFNMDLRVLVPLLTPFTRYSKWKLKMISYLKRQGLYDLSIGIGKESYKYENDWLNDGDKAFAKLCLAFSPILRYLILLNTQRISGQNWIEPLERTMRIIIEIWRSHPTPQEFFIQKSRPLLSLMKLFKMKNKHNLIHNQFELKKVSWK